ncbi:hypothetical protein J4Q44_G00085700 [Coregonus suidteri]|uniref:Uncharacterized protein n=1 Tax=Coregonus suidteri TaxID=861788 RepID=A0AAN8M414_9TELE
MQLSDRIVFKGLKAFYNRAADQWMTTHPGKRIGIYQMAGLFAKAYNKVASVERGVEGFRASGLWPLEKDIFTEANFMAAEVIEEPEPIAAAAVLLELSPRPRPQEARPRKRKAESAAVLTASPYKRLLEDRNINKMKRERE